MLQEFFSFILLIYVASALEFNLFGQAGQAYSVTIFVGTPGQKLEVIVDTGSTTLAIASNGHNGIEKYFHTANSTTFIDTGKEVQAKYSQGMWVGHLASDVIIFPSLKNVPRVASDFAVITNSHNFFVNSSGWQGLLGLAYLPVGAWSEEVVVGSWLDSIESHLKKHISFELKLCGPISVNNATHYGLFSMNVDDKEKTEKPEFHTSILHKRWYEVGVLNVNIIKHDLAERNHTNDTMNHMAPNMDICQILNDEKSILDSGTTNIRLPDDIFREVVDSIRKEARSNNILILDEFWYHGEAACWPEPQEWTLPWIAIDLLNMEDEHSYFVLQVPPQNYMRVVSAHNNSGETVSQYCYKLGLEAGGKDTVLGYTAMEGLQVLFNRSGGWIGFSSSDCGANARLSGPYYVENSLVSDCQLRKPETEVAVSIKAAQWALLAISIIAGTVLLYLLVPCLKTLYLRPKSASRRSVSRNALFDQELS